MIREGKGAVCPTPVIVPCDEDARILIEREATRRSAYKYNQSGNEWKNGFLGDPKIPIIRGMWGEWACCSWLNMQDRLGHGFVTWDWTLKRRGGDGGIDLHTRCGLDIGVKTNGSLANPLMIRRVTAEGKLLPIDPVHAFVLAFWPDKSEEVKLLGWCSRKDMDNDSRVIYSPGKRGKHRNLELETKWLRPMSDLVNLLWVETRLRRRRVC
jgi:hypothetical protein